MLNIINKIIGLFFLVILGHNASFAKNYIPSKDTLSLEKLVNVFQLSNQKKYLHAIISNEISVSSKSSEYPINDKLIYMFIQDLLNTGFYQEAFALLNESKGKIDFKDPLQAWKFYYWTGLTYRFDNKFDSAQFYFDLAIVACKKTTDLSDLGTIYYDKGKTFQRTGDRDAALPYYLKANRLITDDLFSLAQAKRRISTTYSLRKQHALALKFIDEALALYIRVDSSELGNDTVLDYGEYANLLQSRAYVYREMAKNNKDSIRYLNYSLQDAKTSIVAFEKQNRGLVFESDLIYSNLLYKYFYSKTLEALSRLYDATQNKSLLLQALQYAEMDKSSALVRTVQKEIALNQSGIPVDTVNYVKYLYKKLGEVEARRFEENANARVNDTALYELNIELYDLVSKITGLEKVLEFEYPRYKDLKYKVAPPNLDFILKESYKRAILEYVVSDEKIYAFLIVDGVIHYNNFYFRDDFLSSVERLQQMVSDLKSIDFSLKELNEFETLSYGLYTDIVKPFENFIGKRPLLVVPDEQLSLIPFEVLLNKPSVSKSLNYGSLPYLVKSNDISYAYSLTLSDKQKNIVNDAAGEQLLAMAPNYENLAGNQGSQYIALRRIFRDARDNLGMLEGAKAEAKQISHKVKGTLLLNNKASEEQFKKRAPHYKVLHLAMHTLINNEEPLYSKLVFTPDADELEDGLLNTYELSNMELNADLVVLSACNTGFGKLNKGEGIIGLTRGFLQAGCKSLLATLWSVADKASVALINDFYDGLKENKTKSASLSAAKRNYLNNVKGMNAHPFFWAGYISIGNDEPISLKGNSRVLLIFIASMLGLVFLIIVWLGYKRKSRKSFPAFSQTKQRLP